MYLIYRHLREGKLSSALLVFLLPDSSNNRGCRLVAKMPCVLVCSRLFLVRPATSVASASPVAKSYCMATCVWRRVRLGSGYFACIPYLLRGSALATWTEVFHTDNPGMNYVMATHVAPTRTTNAPQIDSRSTYASLRNTWSRPYMRP